MALHPRLPLAFVLCELQSKLLVRPEQSYSAPLTPVLQVYSVDQETSGLGLLQEVLLSSTNGDYGAEIIVQVWRRATTLL